MEPLRISFAEAQFVDLAEQGEYAFPSPIQRLVLPIVSRDHDTVTPLGTGFLASPHVLITARHVIEDAFLDVMSGNRALAALYLSDQPTPSQDRACWGGPLPVRHISVAQERGEHDLALLTIDHPYIDGEDAASPNTLPLTFQSAAVGDEVLVLGYSDMVGGSLSIAGDGNLVLPHAQVVRASQGVIEEVHPESRDSVMLTFPVSKGDFQVTGGMSGGPVIRSDGRVIGVVTTGFDTGDGAGAISYASMLAPLLQLSAALPGADPPEFRTVHELLDMGALPADGSHTTIAWE